MAGGLATVSGSSVVLLALNIIEGNIMQISEHTFHIYYFPIFLMI